MWISLDFTSWYINGLLFGLFLVVIGISIRKSFPKIKGLGTFIVVIGSIPALLGGFFLVAEPVGKWLDDRQNKSWTEELASDRDIQGLRLPRGTMIEWIGHPPVILGATLAQPVQLLGLSLEGELKFRQWSTSDGSRTGMDLETGTLAADHLIDGVPCKAHGSLEFFRVSGPEPPAGQLPKATLGTLKHCTSSADFDLHGNRYQANAAVTLDSPDEVERGILAGDQNVDGHWCKAGTKVERKGNRAVSFTLARDETVEGIACKAGTEVGLEYEKGRITSAVLSRDQEVSGIPCQGGKPIGFAYGDGSYPLDGCVLSRPSTVLDVVWPKGTGLKSMSMNWLEATLPAYSGKITVGELTVVGPGKVRLKKPPTTLESFDPLEDQPGYAELRGARFTEFFLHEGSGWGTLAYKAMVEGTVYEAGTSIRINNVHNQLASDFVTGARRAKSPPR